MLDNCALLLTCDQRGGLAFNRRRQRRSKVVIADMLELADQPIYIRECSEKLFSPGEYVLFDNILDVPAGQFVFEELGNDSECYKDKYCEIVLYRWQRNYPSDVYLPDGLLNSYTLEDSREIQIGSEEFVTVEIYKRGVI